MRLTRLSMLLSAFLFLFYGSLHAIDEGYEINIKINGFESDTCFIAYHLGSKQYIKDTLAADETGSFKLKGEEDLPGGIYMVVMPPQNNYFEFLISGKDDQYFSMETHVSDPVGNMKIKDSEENNRFFKYLNYIREKGASKKELQEKEAKEQNEKDLQVIQEQLDAIDTEVTNYQENLIKTAPGSFLSKIIKMTIEGEIPQPEIEMTEEEESLWRFTYYKSHFLDPVDFADRRILRTPLFQGKIDNYLNKLTVNHPDSIMISVEEILGKAEADEEVFKFVLIHLLNTYAKSNIVGMDAVYVFIVDNYYAKGKADWVDEETLGKMEKRARELRPLLIGKIAPDIQMKTFDGKPVSLHKFEAKYTLLYFWDPNCGHCKKAAPTMLEFSEKFKDKGLRVFSVCTKDKEVDMCAQTVIEKGFTGWTNVCATEDKEVYYRYYYSIRTTPVIYILDKDKKILSKNIGAEQLEEVMNIFIEQEGR